MQLQESQTFCWSRFNEHLLLFLHVEHLVHWWIMQIRHHLFLHYIIRHGMNLNEQNSTRTRPELKQNSSTTWAEPEQNSSTTRAQLKQNSVTTRAKTNMFQIFSLDPCLTSFFTTYEYSLTHELWKKDQYRIELVSHSAESSIALVNFVPSHHMIYSFEAASVSSHDELWKLARLTMCWVGSRPSHMVFGLYKKKYIQYLGIAHDILEKWNFLSNTYYFNVYLW